MLNQTILVGRLTKDPVVKTLESGKKVSNITLAVQRSYKSQQTGEYDTDFLTCTLWEGIAETTMQYCKKGSTVGVKARLMQKSYTIDDDHYLEYPEIIVEKITFIQT